MEYKFDGRPSKVDSDKCVALTKGLRRNNMAAFPRLLHIKAGHFIRASHLS